jgi:two-component system, OmpR family, sensor histidine kinase KdpD
VSPTGDHQLPDDERPSPDEMLDRVRRQAGSGARGRLRIYLGMAPGVGKTFAMLNEANRRKARGTDVVAGFVETYGRPMTQKALGDIEIIPRKKIPYQGTTLEELDTDAVIARKPAVALVDELAHTNAPGSKHEKRWQDVEDLIDAGITVISTVNIQHLESLADLVQTITGVAVRERIPDAVIDGADEIELVDITPHALRQRMQHGNIYPPDRAKQALERFFREGNLGALRELALRRAATTVERQLEEYMHDNEVEGVWPAAERVLVAVNDDPRSQNVIRRASREATRAQTELIAVFVETPRWASASPEARRGLQDNLRFAEDLGAKIVRIQDGNVVRALAKAASEQNAGTIVVGHPPSGRIKDMFFGSVAHDLLRACPGVDLRIVPLTV